MSDDLPRKHYPLSAVDDQDQSPELTAFLEQFATDLRGAVVAAAVASIKDMADLRERVESLERAQGLKPGTSMHASWKEGTE